MVYWDNLTKNDREMLKLLAKKENEAGLPAYDIGRILDINIKSIYNSIHKLNKRGFITIINNTPKIAKLTFQGSKVFLRVRCPKCKDEFFVDDIQRTAVCRNEDCKTKSGKQTRFYINKRRIISQETIIIRR